MDEPKPTTEEKLPPLQFSDVRVPTPQTAEPSAQPAAAPSAPSIDGVKAAPPAEAEANQPVTPEAKHPEIAKKTKEPKQHGVGGAIFAAVIIVLGLGAMLTYAYLQSQ